MAAAVVAVLWKVVVLLWCDHDHEFRSEHGHAAVVTEYATGGCN